MLSILLICSVFPINSISYVPLDQTGLPSFLEVGSFAQYKQEFSIGDVHELRWEIMSIEGNMVEIEIRSQGLFFNTTTKSFELVPGGGTFIIDKDTWVIQDAYFSNGTEMDGHLIGETLAFWISSDTNESTPINTMYEENEYPTLTDPLGFDCLSSTRTCWKTENVYSAGNQMNRYYDVETGIILMIETQRTVSSVEISILETLNETNIGPLITNQIDDDSGLIIAALLIVLPVSSLIVLVLYLRRKKQ